MKASELVALLEKMIAKHGDRMVYHYVEDHAWVELTQVGTLDDPPSRADDPYEVGSFGINA